MKQAVHIFRKDIRHHWLLILTVQALIALHARQAMFGQASVAVSASVSPIGLFYLLVGLSTVLMPLALIFAIAALIQEEALVGTNQFWLTRPYSRLSLVTAKGAFFVAFLFLPLLAHHLFLILHFHFPISAAIPSLLLTFGQLVSLLVLFVSIATLTSTLPRFVLASILSVALTSIALVYISGASMGTWDPLSDIRSGVAYLVVLIAGIVISSYQYATRRTTWTRVAAVAALCAVVVIFGSISLGMEWKIYSRFRPTDSRFASARLDSSMNPEGLAYTQSPANAWAEQNLRTLSYPFQVTGLPSHLELHAFRLAGRLESPAKTQTIFEPLNFLFEPDNSPRLSLAFVPSPPTQQIPSKQLVPLLTVPRQSFDGWKNTEATISGTMYFQAHSMEEKRVAIGRDHTLQLGKTETCDVIVPPLYQDSVSVSLICTDLEPGSISGQVSASAALTDGTNVWPSQGNSSGQPGGSDLLPALFTPIRATSYTFDFRSPLHNREMQPAKIVPGWLDGKEFVIVAARRNGVLKLPFHIDHVIPGEIDTQAWEARRAVLQKH